MKETQLHNLFSAHVCLYTPAQVPSHVPTNGLVGYWPFNLLHS